VDQLPAGLVAVKASALESQELSFEPSGRWGECEISSAGRTVTCTYQAGATIAPLRSVGEIFNGVVPSSLAPVIGIEVESVSPVTSGMLVDDAMVSGGGAAGTASGVADVGVGLSAAPFGVAGSDQWSANTDGTPATQAGSHPYETTTSLTFNNEITGSGSGAGVSPTGGVARDVRVELPAGLVGNPNAVPKCPRPDFDLREVRRNHNPVCPSDTQVGVATVYIEPNLYAELPVYNLVPPAGVPAQFGFGYERFAGFLDATVKPNAMGEYAVSVEAQNLKPTETLSGATVAFWGDPAEPSHDALRFHPGENEVAAGNDLPSGVPPRPFLDLPTSCGVPQTLALSTVSWEDPLQTVVPFTGLTASTDEQENPVSLEGCSKLDFSPSLELSPETSATDSPTGIEANLRLPQSEDPNGLAEADLKDASVTLPPNWSLSPAAANGLEACSPSELGLGNEQQPTCPAASKIGDLEVTTAILEHPLEGEIYVAQQGTVDGSLLGGYLVVDDPRTGVLIKLPGRFEVGGQEGVRGLQPGQIRAVFDNSPQFPFSDLKLKFFGGAHAALMTPQTCGSASASTQITGWNGAVVEPASNSIATNTGCSPPNTPGFTAGAANAAAGTYSPFSLTLKREDGTQRFGAVSVTLPPGLLGKLAGVGRCPNADIEAAERLNRPGNGATEEAAPSCPASSEIGTVTATAGPGVEPVSVTGHEYLSGPYEGAPFSLDAITPAVAGPFDLGVVVVRQGLYINRATGQPTVKSDPFPTIVQGVPLDIRSLTVNVTRPGFTFNPTNCAQLGVTGSVTSTEGSTVGISSNFKAAGCSKLPFKPVLSITTSPKATKAYGASLKVKLTQKPGEANIHRLNLQIPTSLPARLTTLQKACTAQTFEENPAHCPAGSVIGTAKAVTPVLQQPVSGPMILVSHGGAAFPDVEMVLQGEGITIIVDGKTNIKKGITYSKFEAIPDAPISSFEAKLPTGPNSIFAAFVHGSVNANLCGSKLQIPTTIEGQNGALIKETTKIGVTGCPRAQRPLGVPGRGKAKKAKAASDHRRAHRVRTANIGRRAGS
jgi:hypothetical protein